MATDIERDHEVVVLGAGPLGQSVAGKPFGDFPTISELWL
jgi:hypothetical protein